MFGFTYRLVLEDGTPADPPSFSTSVPTWREGDTFMVGPGREFRIIRIEPRYDALADATWTVEAA